MSACSPANSLNEPVIESGRAFAILVHGPSVEVPSLVNDMVISVSDVIVGSAQNPHSSFADVSS